MTISYNELKHIQKQTGFKISNCYYYISTNEIPGECLCENMIYDEKITIAIAT